jgi:hypothetical protein
MFGQFAHTSNVPRTLAPVPAVPKGVTDRAVGGTRSDSLRTLLAYRRVRQTWGFTTTSGGSDTWVITNVALVRAVRAEARWLRLRASHGGDTSGADVDLGVIQPPRPAATVSSRDVPALDETTCWHCGTRPIHRGRQCRSCSADRIAVAERRDEDIDAHRGLVTLRCVAERPLQRRGPASPSRRS